METHRAYGASCARTHTYERGHHSGVVKCTDAAAGPRPKSPQPPTPASTTPRARGVAQARGWGACRRSGPHGPLSSRRSLIAVRQPVVVALSAHGARVDALLAVDGAVNRCLDRCIDALAHGAARCNETSVTSFNVSSGASHNGELDALLRTTWSAENMAASPIPC